VTLHTERVRTLEQVRAFVEGSEAVDFAGIDRAGICRLIRRALVRLEYPRLGKPDKGLAKRCLGKAAGLSRAQLTRLTAQRRAAGRIEDRRRAAPAPWRDLRATGCRGPSDHRPASGASRDSRA